jgi:Tfp pilus assembly protein PilN
MHSSPRQAAGYPAKEFHEMIHINLLKPEKRKLKEVSAPLAEAAPKKKPEIGNLVLLLLIVIVAALFFLQKQAVNRERSLLAQAQEEKGKLQYVVATLKQLEQQKASLESKIGLINQLMSHQDAIVRIMGELSASLPEWVWLQEATYNNQALTIKGKALSNNLIADFIANLENCPSFSNVNLVSSTQRTIQSRQYLEFSLTAGVVLQNETPPEGPAAKPSQRGNR